MKRLVRERAPEAEASLSAATFVGEDAPRVGLSRAQALDIVLERAQADGASPAYARILRGAADVFGRVPLDQVSVALVLEASGISRRTFYQFFESMAQVMDALLAIIASIWLSDVRRALAEDASRDALAGVFVRAFRVGGFLLRALFAEATRPGSTLSARYEGMLDAITDEAVTALAQPPARRARTRAEIVAMLAVIASCHVDPDSTAREARAVADLLAQLFAET